MKPEAVGPPPQKKIIASEPHDTNSHFSPIPGPSCLLLTISYKDSASTARREGRATPGSQVPPRTISAAERDASLPPIYSECGAGPPRGSAPRGEEAAAASHSSHLEPRVRRNSTGEEPTQKEYKAEVISPGDEDSSTSFPHHLSLTPPRAPSQRRQAVTPGHGCVGVRTRARALP